MNWECVCLILGLSAILCTTAYCIVNRICSYLQNKYDKEICKLLEVLKK